MRRQDDGYEEFLTLAFTFPGNPSVPFLSSNVKVTECSLFSATVQLRRSKPNRPPCKVSVPFPRAISDGDLFRYLKANTIVLVLNYLVLGTITRGVFGDRDGECSITNTIRVAERCRM